MAARMSSADLIHLNGLGSALCWSRKALMAASSSSMLLNATADLLPSQQGEEALHLVQPRTAGRRQVHVPARTLGQPVVDRRCLVGRIVVPDQMHLQPAGHGSLDLVEEAPELDGPMARVAFADHLSGGDVKRGKQRGRAMP